MTALSAIEVGTAPGVTQTVRLVRAPRGDVSLAETLVDIDLQSFVEATYSHYTAAALMHQGEAFLLRAGDEIVGAALCVRSWHDPDEAMLLSMGIVSGWRGRGLGMRFVQGVLHAVSSDGFRALTLLVGSDNVRAVRMYRDVGFDVVSQSEPDALTGESLMLLRVPLPVPQTIEQMPR